MNFKKILLIPVLYVLASCIIALILPVLFISILGASDQGFGVSIILIIFIIFLTFVSTLFLDIFTPIFRQKNARSGEKGQKRSVGSEIFSTILGNIIGLGIIVIVFVISLWMVSLYGDYNRANRIESNRNETIERYGLVDGIEIESVSVNISSPQSLETYVISSGDESVGPVEIDYTVEISSGSSYTPSSDDLVTIGLEFRNDEDILSTSNVDINNIKQGSNSYTFSTTMRSDRFYCDPRFDFTDIQVQFKDSDTDYIVTQTFDNPSRYNRQLQELQTEIKQIYNNGELRGDFIPKC